MAFCSRFFWIVLSIVIAAQAAYFTGKVVDSSNKGVGSALVYIKRGDSTYTNSLGNYILGSSSPVISGKNSPVSSAVKVKAGKNLLTVSNTTATPVYLSLFTVDGKCIASVAVGANRNTVLYNVKVSGSTMVVYHCTGGGVKTSGTALLNSEITIGGFNLSNRPVSMDLSLAKRTAVVCTLWVEKQGYTTKSFAQTSCEKTNLVLQVLPASSQGSTCITTCPSGQVCRGGYCVSESDLQHCVDVINSYRAKLNLSALSRSTEIENFAAEGAKYDADKNSAHAHFKAMGSYTLTDAENEIPGWPLKQYGTIVSIIDKGTQMMWNEGPGGGHYENIKGSHSKCGCGIYVTGSNNVWIVQDFK